MEPLVYRYQVNTSSTSPFAGLDTERHHLADYYPFGMEMPGRRWRATGEDATRFGFNGKENDNEVKGEGNQQNYGFRIYDPRIARFLSVDPLSQYYPSWSPYPFAMNRVIDGVDLDGKEFYAANAASRDKIFAMIRVHMISTDGFSWSEDDGRLMYKGDVPLVLSPAIMENMLDMLTLVRSPKPIMYFGDAESSNTTSYEVNIPGLESFSLTPQLAEREAETHVSPAAAVVFQNPMLSMRGRFKLIDGEHSQPCETCIMGHEFFDHVVPWVRYGVPDQPNAITTGDLVSRHSDALNQVGQPGRRSGSEHDNVQGLPIPSGTTTSPASHSNTSLSGAAGSGSGGTPTSQPTPSAPRQP